MSANTVYWTIFADATKFVHCRKEMWVVLALYVQNWDMEFAFFTTFLCMLLEW